MGQDFGRPSASSSESNDIHQDDFVDEESSSECLQQLDHFSNLVKKSSSVYWSDESLTDGIAIIPLCCQLENWDCGIACILMLLRWFKDDLSADVGTAMTIDEVRQRQEFVSSIGSQSIWTADLVVILEDLIAKEALALAKYLFCSKVLIVDTQHSRLDYYRAAFDDDSIRVSQKFDQLKAHGAPMLQIPNLSIHKVIDLIKVPNCVAIALVDNSILCPPAGEENSKKSNNDGEKMSYTGHYVLLCGISDNPNDIQKAISVENKAKHTTHCLVLLDPGKEITMYVTVERFEAAWRARGTDEDIIFVAKTIIT